MKHIVCGFGGFKLSCLTLSLAQSGKIFLLGSLKISVTVLNADIKLNFTDVVRQYTPKSKKQQGSLNMLGKYRFIVTPKLPLSVPRNPTLHGRMARRWSSTPGLASSQLQGNKDNNESKGDNQDEIKEEHLNQTEENQRHQKIEPEFMSFPWETSEKESQSQNSTNQDLPWASGEDPDVELTPETEITDPSKNELILAPLRKKSSPIERLTPRKSLSSRTDRSSEVNFQIERDYKNLMQFKYSVSSDDFINIIEELRPTTPVVTVKQLTELSSNLDKSFRGKQIRQYIEQSCPEIALKKSMSKKKLINKIISEHWKLKVTLDPTGDLVSETRIDLSNKRDLFLLLSNRGFLPQHWSLIGAQLSLGTTRKELVVRGSKNIVNFVQASWNDLLNNISTDTVDLGAVAAFYKSLGKKLDINTLQHECGVYFDQVSIDKNSYVLSAIKNASISNAKIEILKATEYRKGHHNSVVTDLLEMVKAEYPDLLIRREVSDESLPWYIKQENYFRYSMTKKRLRESLLSDESMIVESLSNEVQELKVEVEEAREKFEYNYVQTEDESNAKKHLKSRKSDNKLFHIEDGPVAVSDSDKLSAALDVSHIKKELTEDEFEGKNDSSKLMLDNVVSVKFGKLLLEKQAEEETKRNNSYFSENLPEVIRQVGKLELMDKESRLFGATGGIMNRFNRQIYVKLIPNGFWGGKFENFVQYPSIEILFDLKDGKLETNGFSAFMSEYEKNVEVSLPHLDVDMKFQSSYNSMLVYNRDQWILNGRPEELFRGLEDDKSDNDITLNKKQINMYISQIGKRQFDVRRTEGLLGMLRQFRHKPYTFYFPSTETSALEMVKYSAVRVELVRGIELEYEGLPVSLELHDDGEHERVEVSMLKEGVDMDAFVQHSAALARFLSV